MSEIRIGKRERVQDIRQVWGKETDFSNWLVTDEGKAFLAEELDIEVENLTRESRPGDFPCDIVGHLLGDDNHIIVIENQYGRTNHDHLGKLLTYAAVHKAMTGIWISESISDDHRQVIDWLNENTPANVNLYLVGLKLYQIGDSPVAPQLDVVCRPNYAVKETKTGLSQADIERHSWRRKMWKEIQDSIKAVNPPFNLQRPSNEHWSSISIGRSGFYLNMLLTPSKESIGIDLYIQVPWKAEAFEALELQKESIEKEIGAELNWMPLEGKKTARILLETKILARSPENESKVKEWFTTNSVLMYKAFKKRVLELTEPTNENGRTESED
jgi:hypothetical protein